MIREEEIFKIGKLAKTHGLKGEISFRFDSDVFDQVDCPYLILKIDGIFVPFFIEEYRFKGSETALMTFEDIDNDEKASKLQGLEVYFPRKYYIEADEDEELDYSWDYFVGMTAIDKKAGLLGTIVEVDTKTINTLFRIENESGEEYIIPAAEEFMLSIDAEKKELQLELPEGLIED